MHVAQLYHKRVTLADNKSIQNTEAPFVLNENSGQVHLSSGQLVSIPWPDNPLVDNPRLHGAVVLVLLLPDGFMGLAAWWENCIGWRNNGKQNW